MEIVLALLLLFGGFMLGSVTTKQDGDDQRPSAFSSHGDETAGSHRATQSMEDSKDKRPFCPTADLSE